MQKQTATEIRRALSRFPRWTQRYWTWQTAIAEPSERRRRAWRARTHALALVLTWLVMLIAGTVAADLALDAIYSSAAVEIV